MIKFPTYGLGHIQLREDIGCLLRTHFVRPLRLRSFRPLRLRLRTHHHRHREQRRHDPDAGLHRRFTEKTGIEVEWVTLEENVLRQRVTTDITTKGGQFDIMTIGMYETPIWGANGWLVPLDDLSASTTSTTSCPRCATA
jgi:hypothetical protein